MLYRSLTTVCQHYYLYQPQIINWIWSIAHISWCVLVTDALTYKLFSTTVPRPDRTYWKEFVEGCLWMMDVFYNGNKVRKSWFKISCIFMIFYYLKIILFYFYCLNMNQHNSCLKYFSMFFFIWRMVIHVFVVTSKQVDRCTLKA